MRAKSGSRDRLSALPEAPLPEAPPADLASALELARSRGAGAFVAIVTDPFSDRVVASLARLPDGALALFQVCETRSEEGPRAGLAPVDFAATPRLDDPETFLAGLPAAVRVAAERLLAKLARLDREIDRVLAADAVAWTCSGRPLCAVARAGDDLRGEIASHPSPISIRTVRDAEAFLDEVLREHIARLSDAGGPGSGLAGGSEPLLTPEEIAAFRD